MTKLLHLVLYSPNEYYTKMYELLNPYYKQYNWVTTIYYYYNEDLEKDFELNDNCLLIKGKEDGIMSILEKTIKAFSFFKSDIISYNYVLRSNISTIVNFNLLEEKITSKVIDYGGYLYNLQWLDYPGGIYDNTYFGTVFVGGTAILFSSNLIELFLKNIDKINKKVIDDVSFGIFAKENSIVPTDLSSYSLYLKNYNNNFEELEKDLNNRPNIIYYRNRVNPYIDRLTESRLIDITQMEKVISFLNRRL